MLDCAALVSRSKGTERASFSIIVRLQAIGGRAAYVLDKPVQGRRPDIVQMSVFLCAVSSNGCWQRPCWGVLMRERRASAGALSGFRKDNLLEYSPVIGHFADGAGYHYCPVM